jgi:hypothetical protein
VLLAQKKIIVNGNLQPPHLTARKGDFCMKTWKLFNIVAILAFTSIMVIFTACKEENERFEEKTGGTLVVYGSNNYPYVSIFFDGLPVYRKVLRANDIGTVTSNKDVAYEVTRGLPNFTSISIYNKEVGLLQGGKTISCSLE